MWRKICHNIFEDVWHVDEEQDLITVVWNWWRTLENYENLTNIADLQLTDYLEGLTKKAAKNQAAELNRRENIFPFRIWTAFDRNFHVTSPTTCCGDPYVTIAWLSMSFWSFWKRASPCAHWMYVQSRPREPWTILISCYVYRVRLSEHLVKMSWFHRYAPIMKKCIMNSTPDRSKVFPRRVLVLSNTLVLVALNQ